MFFVLVSRLRKYNEKQILNLMYGIGGTCPISEKIQSTNNALYKRPVVTVVLSFSDFGSK